jgi:cyanophycin synthetase
MHIHEQGPATPEEQPVQSGAQVPPQDPMPAYRTDEDEERFAFQRLQRQYAPAGQPHIHLRRFQFYTGPSFYLDCRSMVFNIFFEPSVEAFGLEAFREEAVRRFPRLVNRPLDSMADLFAAVLVQVLKMDLNLYLDKYELLEDGEEFTIAVEILDEYVSEYAAYFVLDWLESVMTNSPDFDFMARYRQLKQDFNDSAYGGPTIYSIVEAAMKRNIPVHYLPIEGQFQWGFGKNSVRGKSTIFDVDGIKDTEFTEYKDACKDFLSSCGFPTPKGGKFRRLESILEEAAVMGFPVVLKPVAGHKGQGVTTNIESEEEVRAAYERILQHHAETGTENQGIIIEQQVYGTDHRLLAIGGKFVAALEREPAFVVGDAQHTVEELIHLENKNNPNRSNNLRAPLALIKIDDDMASFLALQGLSMASVLPAGQKVFLRRVANISAGGLSKNVTDVIHPDNVQLVENIASFFRLTAMGIDVIAQDISKSWQEGQFGIIEINAGPGIYMHLAPAIGAPIDVPGIIMSHFFPTVQASRIPIIAGNKISLNLCQKLYERVKQYRPQMRTFGSVTAEGAYLNGKFFTNNAEHDKNVQLVLRHISLEMAVFQHTSDDIHDYGTYHQGADIVILEAPTYAEKIMLKDLLPGGYVIDVSEKAVEVFKNRRSVSFHQINEGYDKDEEVLKAITPLLPELLAKYP